MAFVDSLFESGCDNTRSVNIPIFNTLGSVSTGGAKPFTCEFDHQKYFLSHSASLTDYTPPAATFVFVDSVFCNVDGEPNPL